MRKLLILTLIQLIWNQLLCEIIFEDNFETLDKNKWELIGKKAECAEVDRKYNVRAEEQNCNTNRDLNLRALKGMLILTARKERYFESEFTTAAIVSKQSFQLNCDGSSLLFKIRAAIPAVKGLIPKIYILSDSSKDDPIQDIDYFNIAEYNGSSLRKSTDKSVFTDEINNREFQNYEMLFDKDYIIWQMNGLEMNKIPNNVIQTIKEKNKNSKECWNFNLVLAQFTDATFEGDERYCNSLFIDYVKVYKYNQPIINEVYGNEKANVNELCLHLKILNEQAYFKFEPTYSVTDILLTDKFNGNSLDQTIWMLIPSENQCKDVSGTDMKLDQSCDIDHNFVIHDGKLTFILKDESKLGQKSARAIIATRACFKNARIEVKAKIQQNVWENSDILFYMQADRGGCNKGPDANGRVDIVEHYSVNKNSYFASISDTKHRKYRHTVTPNINWSDDQVYGLEWNESYIQWFLNDRVVYQANRIRDVDNNVFANSGEQMYLPFDHPFNLFISIRVKSSLGIDLSQPCLQINYVKIYGEQMFGYMNKTAEISQDNANFNFYPLVISMAMLILILLVLLFVLSFMWKRKMKRNEQVHDDNYYDDIDEMADKTADKTSLFDECNPNDYEAVNEYSKVDFSQAQKSEYIEMVAPTQAIYCKNETSQSSDVYVECVQMSSK